jgi:phenylalanyl-tRNA synthetase alpha chain
MLDRWVEVGNSGMFRPEMLEPMGFPKDVRVHGWGLSLERPTMIRYARSALNSFVVDQLNLLDMGSTTSGPWLGTKSQ